MNKIIHLAVVLFSATSLTTSVFAGRGDVGADTSSSAPVQPVVIPSAPQTPDSNSETPQVSDPTEDQNDQQNPNQISVSTNPQNSQGISKKAIIAAGSAGVVLGTGAIMGVHQLKNQKKSTQLKSSPNIEYIDNYFDNHSNSQSLPSHPVDSLPTPAPKPKKDSTHSNSSIPYYDDDTRAQKRTQLEEAIKKHGLEKDLNVNSMKVASFEGYLSASNLYLKNLHLNTINEHLKYNGKYKEFHKDVHRILGVEPRIREQE